MESQIYQHHYKHLVFSGGGICGLAHIGGLKALDKAKSFEHIKTFIGSSIGALIAAMCCLDYTPDEMEQIGLSLPFADFKNIEPLKLLTHFGFDSGIKIVNQIREVIWNKTHNTEITLKELYEKTGKVLIITGSCINTGKVLYFSHINTPMVKIYNAIRVSIGIPIYFTAVTYKNKTYIDGAILDNYPIHLLNNANSEDVIGFKLCTQSHLDDDGKPIENMGTYLWKLANCLLGEVERLRNKGCDLYHSNTIKINTRDINSLDFDMDLITKRKLMQIGYDEVMLYLKTKSIEMINFEVEITAESQPNSESENNITEVNTDQDAINPPVENDIRTSQHEQL